MKVRVTTALSGRRGVVTPVGTILEGPLVHRLVQLGKAVEVSDGNEKDRLPSQSESRKAKTLGDDRATIEVASSVGSSDGLLD